MLIFVLTLKDQNNQYQFLNTYNPFIIKINKAVEVKKYWYPDNFPPKENCRPVRVVVWAKVRVSFRLGGNQIIAHKEKCPPSLVSVRFGLGLVMGLRVNFPWGQFS